MQEQTLPVAIIGAGPVGLAAAAHLIRKGETPLLFEAGSTVGASMLEWGAGSPLFSLALPGRPASTSLVRGTRLAGP